MLGVKAKEVKLLCLVQSFLLLSTHCHNMLLGQMKKVLVSSFGVGHLEMEMRL